MREKWERIKKHEIAEKWKKGMERDPVVGRTLKAWEDKKEKKEGQHIRPNKKKKSNAKVEPHKR